MHVSEAQQIRWYTYRAAARVARNLGFIAWIMAMFTFALDQMTFTAFLSGGALASFIIGMWLYVESRAYAP